jgi:hypothetical protein
MRITCSAVFRLHGLEPGVVLAVHGEHHVKLAKILRRYLPGPLVGYVDVAHQGSLDRARVWSGAVVPGTGAGTVDTHMVQSSIIQCLANGPFGHR